MALELSIHRSRSAVAACVLLALSGAALAEEREFVIDVSGIQAFGIRGNSLNPSFGYYLAPNALITGVDWDVEIEALAPTLLYQAAVLFRGADRGLSLVPGFGVNESGTRRFTDRIGSLVEDNLSFRLGEDGLLNAVFFSQWDYDYVEVENTWKSGTITFTYEVSAVPEPASYGLMAAGLLLIGAAGSRRRHPA